MLSALWNTPTTPYFSNTARVNFEKLEQVHALRNSKSVLPFHKIKNQASQTLDLKQIKSTTAITQTMDPYLESLYKTLFISEEDQNTLRDHHQITSYATLVELQEEMRLGQLEDVSECAQKILGVALLAPSNPIQNNNDFKKFLCNDDIQDLNNEEDNNAGVEVTSSDDEDMASIASSTDDDRALYSQR